MTTLATSKSLLSVLVSTLLCATPVLVFSADNPAPAQSQAPAAAQPQTPAPAQAAPAQPVAPAPQPAPQVAPAPKPVPGTILGLVSLGRTTVDQFVNSLANRGCIVLQENYDSATIASNCLTLPGLPLIHAYGKEFGPNVIETVVIAFSEPQNSSKVFNQYMSTLTKNYGDGTLTTPPVLGADQEYLWHCDGMDIALLQKKTPDKIDGTVMYMTPEVLSLLNKDAMASAQQSTPPAPPAPAAPTAPATPAPAPAPAK